MTLLRFPGVLPPHEGHTEEDGPEDKGTFCVIQRMENGSLCVEENMHQADVDCSAELAAAFLYVETALGPVANTVEELYLRMKSGYNVRVIREQTDFGLGDA